MCDGSGSTIVDFVTARREGSLNIGNHRLDNLSEQPSPPAQESKKEGEGCMILASTEEMTLGRRPSSWICELFLYSSDHLRIQERLQSSETPGADLYT